MVGVLRLISVGLGKDAVNGHIGSNSASMCRLQSYVSMVAGILIINFTAIDNVGTA